jgi:hypothetical protein
MVSAVSWETVNAALPSAAVVAGLALTPCPGSSVTSMPSAGVPSMSTTAAVTVVSCPTVTVVSAASMLSRWTRPSTA